MSVTAIPSAPAGRDGKDVAFAVGIVLILCLFFLPVPAALIDLGLALSIALSVLILMVALVDPASRSNSPPFPRCCWSRRSSGSRSTSRPRA